MNTQQNKNDTFFLTMEIFELRKEEKKANKVNKR